MNEKKAPKYIHYNSAKTHCNNGHVFDEKNTYWATNRANGRTFRQCKTCTNVRVQKIKARNKEL